MVRSVRNKKPVDYSQFKDSDDDDDFVSATGPLNKKSRTTPKELQLERPKPKLKNLQKEDIPLQEKTPKKRMALDDKLYQRDLEVALALSVKEIPTVTIDLEDSQDLDKITEDDNSHGARGKRKAASKAAVQQRKILLEGSDGDSGKDSEPDYDTGEDSEDDSDISESEDNDEDFTMRNSKEVKKKEVKVKSPVEKKKKPKSKCNALVTSVDCAPTAIKSKSQPSPKKVCHSSEASRKPLQTCSPSAEIKRPKWVPPAVSRSSGTSSGPLAGVSVKSPNQSLRLGLSRLARVKPLHPNATSI